MCVKFRIELEDPHRAKERSDKLLPSCAKSIDESVLPSRENDLILMDEPKCDHSSTLKF
jgi:hypothetical protein